MFENITVVAIHGNGGAESMIPSLNKSANALPGSQKLLITDKLLNTDIPQKLVYRSFGYPEYSQFVIYCLHEYIDTDYCLIVQDDGWVLNGFNWREEWLSYDYIGGATHAALEGDQFAIWYEWERLFKQPLVVQNGGFSLRSKRFLEAPSRYGITMRPLQDPMMNNEDVQLCCFLRPALESVGMKFAPLEESVLFSFEHLSPNLHKDVDLKKVFGHHGRFRKLVSNNQMKWLMPDEMMKNIVKEQDIFDLFVHYNYEIDRSSDVSH